MFTRSTAITLPTVTGPGFTMRPFREGDAESLQRSLNDKRVARDVSNIPYPYTLEHAREWIALTTDHVNASSRRVDFALVIEDEVIGSVAFINLDHHKAQVSVWVSPAHWGKSIATNALQLLVAFGFSELNLVRIYAYHYTENTKTARVLEKAGFSFEGRHEKEWRKEIDGNVHFFDSNVYAIIRPIDDPVRSVLLVTPDHTLYQAAAEVAERMAMALHEEGVVADTIDRGRDYDLVIAIGGDGTMMRTVKTFSRRSIPTLGVNGGDVGFLTSAEAEDWKKVVERVVRRDYQVEQRLALRVTYGEKVADLIANEVLVRHPSSLVQVAISVDGHVIHEALPADGVLIATATGSTAYNASTGGPIISPSSTSVVLSAISPTILNFRAYVMDEIAQGKIAQLRVVGSKHDQLVYLMVDGQLIGDGLRVGESVEISRSPLPLLFATFGIGQYLEALKTKKGFAR